MNAGPPDNRNGSSQKTFAGYKATAGTLADSSDMSLDEAIAWHLVDCNQCRKVAEIQRPVAMGEKSGHCDVYWGLQLLRAQYEGRVNNVVARTEYGDEAPTGGALE